MSALQPSFAHLEIPVSALQASFALPEIPVSASQPSFALVAPPAVVFTCAMSELRASSASQSACMLRLTWGDGRAGRRRRPEWRSCETITLSRR